MKANLLRAMLIAMVGVGACASSRSPATSVPSRSPSAAGAGLQPMAYGGGDGTTCDQAVVVKERDEIDGVMAEYSWLAARYPNYTKRYQSLGHCKTKAVDKLGIRTSDGHDLEIVFDISSFFGSS